MAVNVNTVKVTLSDLARKQQTTGYDKANRFNREARQVQLDILRELVVQEGPAFFNIDGISIFQKKVTVTVDSSGNFDLPADYLFYDPGTTAISYGKNMDGSSAQQCKQIDLLSHEEFSRRRSNRFEAPSRRRPILRKFATYMEVYPKNPYKFELHYIRMPLDPFWNYSLSGQRQVYAESSGGALTNPNDGGDGSTNFELPEFLFSKIVWRMAAIVGIEVQQQDLTQAGMALQAQ